jgi:DNA-binding MarR family transcriptional regulator
MTDSVFVPGHCVANNLHKTARAVSRVYAEELRVAGLKRSQFSILATLNKAQEVALSELADRLYLERTSLTRNLKPLEAAGFVARSDSPADGRVKLVRITDRGRSKFREARRCWQKAQRRVVRLFGEDRWRDLETQLAALRRVVTN